MTVSPVDGQNLCISFPPVSSTIIIRVLSKRFCPFSKKNVHPCLVLFFLSFFLFIDSKKNCLRVTVFSQKYLYNDTIKCTIPLHKQILFLQRNGNIQYRAGIFKESMGARNRGGRGLSYRPARLHSLPEFIPWNRFRGPIHV